MTLDWNQVKAATPSVAAQYFGELPRDRKVRCPFHADKTASLAVYDDGWHCFGCGEHGDAADLVSRLEGVSLSEAVRRLAGGASMSAIVPAAAPAADAWLEAADPFGLPEHPSLGPPSATYPYHRRDGLVGYVLRWDRADGKTFRPVVWCRHSETGALEWRWRSFALPRPLYRADLRRDACAIVEGEKAADYLRSAGVEAVSWPGGANGWRHADWASLTAKRAILWPDNDGPGHEAMEGIACLLASRGVEIRWVDTSGLAPSADAADLPIAEAVARLQGAKAREVVAPAEVPAIEPEPPQWPFRCLGFRDNRYYFLETRGQQVVDYGPRECSSPGALSVLAPLDWWESMFSTKTGVNWTAAGSAIVDACMRAGYYGPHRERGRGIWRDDGRIIYHRGSEAIVDGTSVRLCAIKSRYAYAIGDELPGLHPLPLTDDQARTWVLQAAQGFSWKHPAYGTLLAGWVATAIVCGALRWRPHIWLTGAAGSGKTTILNNYLGALLGSLALLAQGASSEAGIRQALGTDARPVVFDESESQSEAEQKRIAAVLATIRQASSETASQVYKGTTGAKAVTYHIRSSFCLGSIQVGLAQQADRERITRLVLASAKAGDVSQQAAEATYTAWLATRASWPGDISARLLHRMLKLVPVLLESIETLTLALVPHVSGRREADQLGAMLAGAWCLEASKPPTADEAAAMVAQHDWASILDAASETDAERARNALLGIITMGDTRASVSDRLEALRGPLNDRGDHAQVLGWYGLRVMDDGALFVAHTNENRAAALRGTPWATDLTGLLRQLPGTQTGQARVNGTTTKGVVITVPSRGVTA